MVWLSAVLWIENSTRAEVRRVLDARLVEAAKMVASLVAKNHVAFNTEGPATIALPQTDGTHAQFCQIWSVSGQLVGLSQGAPADRLVPAEATGFRTIARAGQEMRVYTIVTAGPGAGHGAQVTVGDAVAMRDRLVHGVIAGLLWPALVVLPVMAALIWVALARGLAPLERLARDLEGRKVTELGALPEDPRRAPREIRPVTRALNDLFARLAVARARERDFIAYAAHELKTPLAGLRIQADVARRAEDAQTRERALGAIEASVGRTDRMVRQLLDLARVEAARPVTAPADVAVIAREVVSDLGDLAARRGVALRFRATEGATGAADPFLLGLALRNLVENAVQATPEGGTVTLGLEPQGAGLRVDLHDGGPGLPEALQGRATEKFVKGAGSAAQGSGLGLSIAADALETLGARLRFEQRADGHHAVIDLAEAALS